MAKKYYGLKDYHEIEIADFTDGKLNVNDNYIVDFENSTESKKVSKYFDEYEIKIEAIANDGCNFSGWTVRDKETGKVIFEFNDEYKVQSEDSAENNELYLVPIQDIIIEPVFTVD